MDKYNKYFTDMHSNIHHNNMDKLDQWYKHMKELFDFWPIAYYPYHMKPTEWGLPVEDKFDDALIAGDWEMVRELAKKADKEGFSFFMGYEWQGSGKDGDHNVFYLDNEQGMHYPLRLNELINELKDVKAIGIPHHLAYQLEHRGKNWETHDEKFSPFAEIYSSHGSSENDYGQVAMGRHIHMGPRTGQTSVEEGLNRRKKVGIIASGDNHAVPGVPNHGLMCALAKENTKEALWDSFINRRVYGVSNSRIEMDFCIDEKPMGSEITSNEPLELSFDIKGTGAIDRVEILKNNILEEMVCHSGTWENKPLKEKVKMKFKVEFGWGPDRRHYSDISHREWKGDVKVDGKILSIEKCFNHFDEKCEITEENTMAFDLVTHKSTQSGKWMGPSSVQTEGAILEVEVNRDSVISIRIEGDKTYEIRVEDVIRNSHLYALLDEVKALTKERWGDLEHYRSDPFWHNAYKFKVGKASIEESYVMKHTKQIVPGKNEQYRIRVHQVNGDMAWSSPIFVNHE